MDPEGRMRRAKVDLHSALDTLDVWRQEHEEQEANLEIFDAEWDYVKLNRAAFRVVCAVIAQRARMMSVDDVREILVGNQDNEQFNPILSGLGDGPHRELEVNATFGIAVDAIRQSNHQRIVADLARSEQEALAREADDSDCELDDVIAAKTGLKIEPITRE